MSLRYALIAPAVLLALVAGAAPALAQDPRLEALGGSSLAVESETTALSLFNFGNPAGAAFLPRQDRLDLSLRLTERERRTEFTTLFPYSVDQAVQVGEHLQYPTVVTSTVKDYTHTYFSRLDAYGNSAYLDTFGNTLDPYTLYTRRSGTMRADLNDWGRTGYGGYLSWLSPEQVLQVIPLGEGVRVRSAEQASDTSSLLGGGTARGAWLAAPDLAIGAGVTASTGRAQGWGQPDRTPDASGVTTNPRAHYLEDDQRLGAQVGAGWRLTSAFDPQDQLDLGLVLNAQRRLRTYDEELHAGLYGAGPVTAGLHVREEDQPAELRLQGVYRYQSVMDVALDAGFQGERLYRSLTADTLAGSGNYLARAQENLDYELALKVRLPMVRDDDLRFGIVFNNRGVGHPFPSGQYRQYLPSGLYEGEPVLTGSSAIGIATGVVPAEGSLVTLEYFLGSSKSRQDKSVVMSSGYNRFNLGVQVLVVDGLTVRAGYSNLRTGYQWSDRRISRDANGQLKWDPSAGPINPANNTYPTGDYVWETVTLTRSIETSSFRFGVSVGDKPWRVDLALMAEESSPGPFGWTQLDKPASLDNVGLDEDLRYTATLGLSWLF